MKRRLGMVVGVLVMGAVAFSLRQDGLLPDDWVPVPRSEQESSESDAEEPEDARTPERPMVERPRRRSRRPRHGRLYGPAPAAESRRSESVHGQISGRVEDRLSHSPIPNARLTFRHEERLFTARTDGDGEFLFDAPQEGEFALVLAEADGYFSYAPAFGHAGMVFHATSGQSVEGAVIRLEAEAVVRVVVHAPSGEMATARVRVLGTEEGSLSPIIESYDAPGGEVSVRVQQDAMLEATTTAEGSPATGYGRVDATAMVTGVLHIHTETTTSPQGAVRGQVLSLLGSEPIAGAQVDIEGDTPEGEVLIARVSTDDEGHFTYDGDAPGPFTLWARAPGFAAESRTLATRAESTLLLLSEEASVEGRVVDEDGRPVASFLVVAEAHVGVLERHLRAQRGIFDAQGEFHLGGLSSGGYTISVAAEGFAPQTHEVRLARGDSIRTPDFRLTRGASVSGVVRSAGGHTVADARVQVEGASYGLPVSTEVQSNSAGAFRVDGLGPGQVFVTVAAAGHHAQSVAALADGPAIEVVLNELDGGEEPRLELAGIGAALRADGDRLVIDEVLEEGGAALAGLVPGQGVVHIDGIAVDTLGFRGAIGRIRGPAGSQVLLRIDDEAGERDVSVTRVLVRAP